MRAPGVKDDVSNDGDQHRVRSALVLPLEIQTHPLQRKQPLLISKETSLP